MNEIVPRWEWRWFGHRFGLAESRIAALAPSAVQQSSETYLLSGDGDNVKVRDALMDIKVLREVNRDGLEQWTPVMKAGFPLPASEVAKVFAALRLDLPPLRRASYELAQFIDELAIPSGRIRAISVQKRRTRYTVGGCMAELSEVVADGKPTRTIAVESEDAAAVIAAVRSLGLAGYVNTSYPRGLAALVDGAPPRYAVIDVGTNSIKFHVAEQAPDGRWRTVVDRAEITRLGEGLADTNRIGDDAIERAVAAIAGMAEEARKQGALAVVAVGTAGLRIAANRDDVVAAIEKRTGVHIEVISGEDEARLAYLAAKSSLDLAAGSLVVFDTGGGSSQFTFGRGNDVEERFSVDVGAVRYTERFRTRRRRVRGSPERRARRDIGRPCPARRPPEPRRPRGHGRCHDQHHGGEARAGEIRPERRTGHGARTDGDRPADRSLPLDGRRSPTRDRRPAAEAGRSDPGRCVHHPCRHGETWQALAHRQRPWPAPRRAR